jgi:hypothetical protein
MTSDAGRLRVTPIGIIEPVPFIASALCLTRWPHVGGGGRADHGHTIRSRSFVQHFVESDRARQISHRGWT